MSFVTSHLLQVCDEAGYEPWYDVEGIDVADQWERKILQGLLESRWLLLVMTPDSGRSEWVKDDLQVAFGDAAIPVIPLLWRDCKDLDVHIRLPRLKRIDFRDDIESAREKLTRRLAGVDKPPVRIEQDISMELISLVASIKSEQRELESRMVVLLAHLLKWKYQPERRGNSWEATIRSQRANILGRIKKHPVSNLRLPIWTGGAVFGMMRLL